MSISNRYDIIGLVSAQMCNPNGDPDVANRPRVDMQTGCGIITDVAFKSRMRQYVIDAYAGKEGCDVLIKNGISLNRCIAEAVLSANETDKFVKSKTNPNKKVAESAEYMCKKYWDVRAFGGVLSTGLNAGQIRGAAQVGMSLSFDPVDVNVMSITRKCFTDGEFATLEEYDKASENMHDDKKRTMGDKAYIPYGLYAMKMTVSANLAAKVGFSDEDFNILLEAMMQMYNIDVSSSKMGMSVISPVVVFKHVGTSSDAEQKAREALLGCASAYKLFDMLKVSKKDGVEYPRQISDYDIMLDMPALPNGVECCIKQGAYSSLKQIMSTEKVDLLSL